MSFPVKIFPLLLLAGCATAPTPAHKIWNKIPLPPPKPAAVLTGTQTPIPPRPLWLTWTAPVDWSTNWTIEIWTNTFPGPRPTATASNGWGIYTNADNPPVPIPNTLPQLFFIGRTRDKVTGLTSGWNQ